MEETPNTSTPSTSSARQRQLLDHLRQNRHVLQGQHQRLYDLLSPISPPDGGGQLQNMDVTPVDFPRHSGEHYDPPSLSTWPNQQQQYDQEYLHIERERTNLVAYDGDENTGSAASGSTFPPPNEMEDDEVPSSTSDFVKKLYRMMDEPSFQSIVCWGPMGDYFVVKDISDFAKTVLPQMFKHSNFASFVRQLNKYDFHKVKRPENNALGYGDHTWTFQHPDFHANRPEALDRIQRKPSALRRPQATASASTSYSSSSAVRKVPENRHYSSLDLQGEPKSESPMELRMGNLEENQQFVLEEMVGFQQAMAGRDRLMQRTIGYNQKSEEGGVLTSTAEKQEAVPRSTFVTGWHWAVPPHVLLVDDDAVSRKLIGKFLEMFGCTMDLAVDGIGALNNMNLENYDLVLMDIVMPELDGISATNLIRKFNKGTPIIAMTGNSSPEQIMSYFSSGMNDILTKPFDKNGLLNVLESHLGHLKVEHHEAGEQPQSTGVRPFSDSNIEHGLAASAGQQQQQAEVSRALSSNNPYHDAPSPFNFPLFDDDSSEAPNYSLL